MARRLVHAPIREVDLRFGRMILGFCAFSITFSASTERDIDFSTRVLTPLFHQGENESQARKFLFLMRFFFSHGNGECFLWSASSEKEIYTTKMSSVVLKSLSILLGLFFIFVGTMKVTSAISKDLHKDLRKDFVKYAKVFPLAEIMDIKIPPKWYRRFVGGVEIICGLALALVPNNKIKQGANIVLLFLMIMAVYSHYMVNDKFERIAPALVFFFMLTGRLVIDFQLKRKMDASATSNGDIATSEEKSRKFD